MVCRNICARIKVGMSSYALGIKYCTNCEVYLYHGGIFCPCCGRQLRTRPLSKKVKENVSRKEKTQV